MASIRRTLSPYHDRTYENGGTPFCVQSPSHKFLTGRCSSPVSTFVVGVRRFLDGVFLQQHSRKGHQTWKRPLYRCLLSFFLGILLGLTPFGSVEDKRSQDFSFEIKPPTVNVQEDVDILTVARPDNFVVDKVELGVERRLNVNEKFDFVPRKVLIVVTPTYNQALQAYYLNRLGQVLRLVPSPLVWIVVEMETLSVETAEMLCRKPINTNHTQSEITHAHKHNDLRGSARMSTSSNGRISLL